MPRELSAKAYASITLSHLFKVAAACVYATIDRRLCWGTQVIRYAHHFDYQPKLW